MVTASLPQNHVVLNSGYIMPRFGLGTWALNGSVAINSVYSALECGYRLIDTAQYYGNEREIGTAVRSAISDGLLTRDKVFITSKIMPQNYLDPDRSIDESLERLGMDYLDLMLVHQSGPNDTAVYEAICRAAADGRVRSVGISNYYRIKSIRNVISKGDRFPAVIQNENHVYYQNRSLLQEAARFDTVIESWYPFGGRGNTVFSFQNPTILAIARECGATPAQVILRWHLQSGYVVIPGSGNRSHIEENIGCLRFALSEDAMRKIDSLDTGRRYENW